MSGQNETEITCKRVRQTVKMKQQSDSEGIEIYIMAKKSNLRMLIGVRQVMRIKKGKKACMNW